MSFSHREPPQVLRDKPVNGYGQHRLVVHAARWIFVMFDEATDGWGTENPWIVRIEAESGTRHSLALGFEARGDGDFMFEAYYLSSPITDFLLDEDCHSHLWFHCSIRACNDRPYLRKETENRYSS